MTRGHSQFGHSNPVVYIPTRGRPRNVEKQLKAWRALDFDVRLVVEPEEHDMHEKLCLKVLGSGSWGYWKVLVPGDDVKGIGPIRNWLVQHAYDDGYKSIILTDDDIKPSAKAGPAGMENFVDFAADPFVLGVTARYSYHDFALGPAIKERDDRILMPTGIFRIIALNVENALEIGNYDTELICVQEDGELMLRGIKRGYPWMIDLAAWTTSMHGRYAPGGISDFMGEERFAIQQACHAKLHAKYPEVVNKPDPDADLTKKNGARISWRKAYDLWLPEWKEWSALHGGDLGEYLY